MISFIDIAVISTVKSKLRVILLFGIKNLQIFYVLLFYFHPCEEPPLNVHFPSL